VTARLDNRRLAAFKLAGIEIPYLKLNSVPKKDMDKFTSVTEGLSIIIKRLGITVQ